MPRDQARAKIKQQKSLKTKSDFLGISYSTACNRLRKKLMFSMATQLGLCKCFRCGNNIQTVDELSIDHKKDWLHVDKELFWDLKNLAFSHLSCNVSASAKKRRRSRGKVKGVRLRTDKKRSKPWEAQISCRGRTKYLGYFKTKKEAVAAYQEAAAQL